MYYLQIKKENVNTFKIRKKLIYTMVITFYLLSILCFTTVVT